MSRFAISLLLSVLGTINGFEAQLKAQTRTNSGSTSQRAGQSSQPIAPPSSKLTLSVIEGRHGSNVLRPPSAMAPTVEVRDGDNRPVTGAVVTFSSPPEAPTVKFPNGRWSYSVVTNTSGQASVESMIPMGAGKFGIQVNATYLDSYADSTILEVNYPTLKAATTSGMINQANRVEIAHEHGISTTTKIGIVSAIAIAAGIGAYFAARGNTSKSAVTAGTPTVGAPK